jgi:hypothetical protein
MGGGHSWRLSELIAIVREFGIEVSRPSSGSHWKFSKSGFRSYPVPASNAERSEIKWQYVLGLCRHFEIPKSRFRPN